MGFTRAVGTCLRGYATFQGRAPRSDYWYWQLFVVIAYGMAAIVDSAMHARVLLPLASVAALLPGLSVTVRRMHDLGRTGWWYLAYLAPGVGYVALTVWLCRSGTRGANRYGPDPSVSPDAPAGVVA